MEEMDSEAIYENFVLRVMAARSPNVRYRKLLDRHAPRTPIKCPLSAPPKPSRSRLSRIALISSISQKMTEDKKRVVRPLLKTECTTPVRKARQVAAKYLTTPRNKKCLPDKNCFRSVQNPKPTNIDVPKNCIVSKALVFHSPKKAVKVKTSAELRTPITKLCDGMSKLEIASQRRRVLGYSSKLSKNLSDSGSRRPSSSQKVHAEPVEQTSSAKREAKLTRSNSAAKRKFMNKDAAGKKQANICSVNDSEECIKQDLMTKDVRFQESRQADDLENSGKCSNVEQSENSVSVITSAEENNEIASGNCAISANQKNENEASEVERKRDEYMDSDHNKENASASDGNRIHDDANERQKGRNLFGMHGKGGQVKKVAQASEKPVMKFKKPKPTTLKPFRLRTDERGILKEASLEKKSDHLAPQSDSANPSVPGCKLQRKQMKDELNGERTSSKASLKPERHHSSTHEQPKPMNTYLGSKSNKNLEKISKIQSSPLQKRPGQPRRPLSTKKETISFLVPGQTLDVIPEVSPEVSGGKVRNPAENVPPSINTAKKETISFLIPDQRLDVIPEVSGGKVRKPAENVPPPINTAVFHSPLRGRKTVTVAVEPNFHSTHVPRSCT